MRASALLFATALVVSPAVAQTAAMTDNDPYIWLEDKDGAKPLAWVEAENAPTLKRLKGDPRYATFYQEALTIAAAKDRIPAPDQRFGRIYNFWRDADHPHGLWRWTSEADYTAAQPNWTVALDLDALGKAEGKQWVWKGATCLQPEERMCLVALSEGGEDAVTYREFDLQTGQFVANGFALPRSKQNVAWVDKDTLLVARDWGAGTTTQSGYAFVVKLLKRGQPLAAATEVYRGAASDQGGTAAQVLTDAQGHRLIVIQRRKTFFGADKLVWTPAGTRKLDLPDRAFPSGMVDGQVIFQTSDPWGAVPAGAVASAPLAEVERGAITPTVIFAPGPRQSIEDVGVTRSRVLLVVNDNVRGRLSGWRREGGKWVSAPVTLPDNSSLNVVSTDTRSDTAYLSATGFLTPSSLYAFDAKGVVAPRQVKALPAKFDASGLVVDQFEAASTDGTKVPYFVVHRRDRPLDGTTPTIMTAYGGFELSMRPSYSGSTGKIWLERAVRSCSPTSAAAASSGRPGMTPGARPSGR